MDLEYIPKNFRNSRGCYDLHAKSNGNNFQLSIEESKKDKKERCLKTRYLVVYMAFMGEFYHYFHRVTMSVAIVAMVNNSAIINETHFPTTQSCMNLIENNSTKQISESATGEFQWSPELQGYILGTSFISFVITIPFLSKCAEIYGGKNTMLCCVFFPSLFLFLTPFAARLNVYVLIAVQFLRGMCEGRIENLDVSLGSKGQNEPITLKLGFTFDKITEMYVQKLLSDVEQIFTGGGIFPATGVLVANWCPKHERGCSYTTALCGVSFGCVVGSYFTGVLCESSILGGWPFAFYVNGSVGFIVSIIIFFFLYDNPSVHPRISPAELDYILSNQENILTEKRPKTPWKSLFTSVPVHALSYAYFGQFWATSHFLTVNPTFLKTILHYSVEQGGFFNALPFLLQILTSQIGGILSTILSEKKCLSTNNARKFWTFLSCFGYSACVLGIYFAGCNRALTIVLSIAALSFVGFSFAGCWVVSADMSPTFAGSINAIACPVGGLSFFLLPVTVGYLTNDMQTIEQWQRIFFICIAIVLSSGVIFCIFGSAEIQPWNEVPEDDSEKVNKKTDVVRMKKF